jgi:hypothetical protein
MTPRTCGVSCSVKTTLSLGALWERFGGRAENRLPFSCARRIGSLFGRRELPLVNLLGQAITATLDVVLKPAFVRREQANDLPHLLALVSVAGLHPVDKQSTRLVSSDPTTRTRSPTLNLCVGMSEAQQQSCKAPKKRPSIEPSLRHHRARRAPTHLAHLLVSPTNALVTKPVPSTASRLAQYQRAYPLMLR